MRNWLLFPVTAAILVGAFPGPASSANAPADKVTVYSFKTNGKCPVCFDEKYYQKPFKDIKLDAKTMGLIREKTAELDRDNCPDKNPLCTYRLISLRIFDGSDVQRMIFGNKLGEVSAWDDTENECWVSLTGNGMLGGCKETMGQ